MKISVIIPCKDRAENTKLILNNLIEQKKQFPQTEIIVVENGSVEDMSFLDDYTNDIILKREQVAGVANARNVGLDLSTGDYICFVDNDDMVSDDYLATIYPLLDQGYDWLIWQWMVDNIEVTMPELNIRRPLKSNWALWGYCLKRSLFNNIRFDVNKIVNEDMIIFDMVTEDTKGYFIQKILYKFTWAGNEDSLSHRKNRGEFDDLQMR